MEIKQEPKQNREEKAKSAKPKSFFKKIDKIDKPLARWTKTNRRKTQITKPEMEVGTFLTMLEKQKGYCKTVLFYAQLHTKKIQTPR